MHRRPRWYGLAVAVAAVALPVAAIFAFLALDAPLATSAAALPPADPNDPAFVVRRAEEIRASRDAYRRFAEAARSGRARERAVLQTKTTRAVCGRARAAVRVARSSFAAVR